MNNNEYRIVEYFDDVFVTFQFQLQIKVEKQFLWFKYHIWHNVGDMTFDKPKSWNDLNIVDTVYRDVDMLCF